MYNNCDNLILDIIGRDSPAVEGIEEAETWGENSLQAMETDTCTKEKNYTILHTPKVTPANCNSQKRRAVGMSVDMCEELKREKFELQIESLKIRNEMWKKKTEYYDLLIKQLKSGRGQQSETCGYAYLANLDSQS